MKINLHQVQETLVVAVKAGLWDLVAVLEDIILQHSELRHMVARRAREKRGIENAAAYNTAHVPGVLRKVKVQTRNKTRITWSPDNSDYVQALYYLGGILTPLMMSMAGESHAFIPEKGTHTAISAITTALETGRTGTLAVQVDIKECFPTVPTKLATTMMPPKTRAYMEALQARYQEVEPGKTGLPQGHPCAPAAVVMALTTIIGGIKGHHDRVCITAYADDITIIGPDKEALNTEKEVRTALEAWGMNLNKTKRRVNRLAGGSHIDVLGFRLHRKEPGKPLTIGPKPGAYANLAESMAATTTLADMGAVVAGWEAAYRPSTDPDHEEKKKQAITAGMKAYRSRSATGSNNQEPAHGRPFGRENWNTTCHGDTARMGATHREDRNRTSGTGSVVPGSSHSSPALAFGQIVQPRFTHSA